MRHLRMTARPPLEEAPPLFRLLVASEHVAEARWIAWNLADSRGVTILLHVQGDPAPFEARFESAAVVVSAAITPAEDGAFYLLATLDPTESPLMNAIYKAISHDGVVMLPPIAEGDGTVEIGLVGEGAAVTDLVETLPAGIDVEVHEVGGGGLSHDPRAVPLSVRQREAVRAALELGYYDQPRGATHEDVAAALDCAPSTASEHLQKAEAKFVRAAMNPP